MAIPIVFITMIILVQKEVGETQICVFIVLSNVSNVA